MLVVFESTRSRFLRVAPCYAAQLSQYLSAHLPKDFFFISFIYTLSPLWDYQYKYDIVHITLSVET